MQLRQVTAAPRIPTQGGAAAGVQQGAQLRYDGPEVRALGRDVGPAALDEG